MNFTIESFKCKTLKISFKSKSSSAINPGETDHEPEAKKQKGKKKGKGEKPQNGGGNSMAKNTPSEKAKKKPGKWFKLLIR